MAQAKVTISTVAPSPEAFHKLAQAPVALAWSVHAVRDELRKSIVPTTRYSMKELRDGYLAALKQKSRKLRTSMIEVVLIAGVNDSPEEADHMADFILDMQQEVEHIKTLVNLIPFNDIGHPTFRTPTMESVRKFQDRLMTQGVMCKIRTTRGDDDSAACGQLATKKKKLNGADSISP
jgi:23S rRNA (adenine2503-C2)-methyltransferase